MHKVQMNSSASDTIRARVARFNEFDNGHVLFDYQKMTEAEFEEQVLRSTATRRPRSERRSFRSAFRCGQVQREELCICHALLPDSPPRRVQCRVRCEVDRAYGAWHAVGRPYRRSVVFRSNGHVACHLYGGKRYGGVLV